MENDMKQQLIDALLQQCESSKIVFDEPMSRHTTFRVGGNADCYIEVGNVNELQKIIRIIKNAQEPFEIIGNGSNLLVSDKGISGCVICFGKSFEGIEVCGNRLKVQSGAMLSKVGKVALERELAGFEFAAGIPGSMGGGTYMNAGAYGGELKDIITAVTVVNENGQLQCYLKEELEFGYRYSNFMEKKEIVVETELQLQAGKKEQIKQKMNELMQKRREKQPLEYPSAGSTFKRPTGYYAGQLIEECGLKGYTVGGAQVSLKHSGFVVNINNATATDIYTLTEDVIKTVKEKYGVSLEREIRVLGEF